jgi:uncharacterized protein YbgA (DUF1722 family)/uncharacterized protein YbbK (DUF523 family)
VSACLLGERVRYDGGHKRDAFLADILGPHVEWVAVCPEVECGMGTPREPIHLVERDGHLRLVGVGSGRDHTDRMAGYAEARVQRLNGEGLSGYVFKQQSPSCGVGGVPVSMANGASSVTGTGLFARELMARYPELPVEEEGRLQDPRVRNHFIERVLAYDRLRQFFDAPWTVGQLVRFHTVHKLTLMAHSPTAYRRLGRLVAAARGIPRARLQGQYSAGFMAAISCPTTPAQHVDVLQHAAGHFKEVLDERARRKLLQCVDDYRTGSVPLEVPVALVRRLAREHDVGYLAAQTYFEPDPIELALGCRA